MPTVTETFEEFTTYLEATGRRPRTVEAYQSRLRGFIEVYGYLDVTRVSQPDLANYTGNREDAQKVRRPATLGMTVQALKTFFQFCVNRGYIQTSPARELRRYERTKAEAHQVNELELVTDLANFDLAKSQSLYFHDLADEFIQSLIALGRRAQTIRAYRQRLSLIANHLVGVQVNQLTPRTIDSLVSIFRAQYAPASVAGLIQTLKTFFRFCMVRGYIGLSPAGHLKKPPLERVPSNKVMSQSDLERMIERANENGATLEYCLLLFMADTGCRVGELIGLDLKDVDLDRCEATVTGKTGYRVLDYGEATQAALKVWLDVRPKTDPVAFFTTREGRISHRCIYTHLETLAADLGIERYNPHAIRHRVGQAWVDSGANLELVRLKLGHRDVTTTAKFYTHQDRDRIKRASQRYSVVGGMNHA